MNPLPRPRYTHALLNDTPLVKVPVRLHAIGCFEEASVAATMRGRALRRAEFEEEVLRAWDGRWERGRCVTVGGAWRREGCGAWVDCFG